MYVSQFPLNTVKETPADAEIASHQLMIRAGLIRKIASGIYTWMPLGLRVMRKVEAIVREEMQSAGAVELLMPAIQPASLWQESGRWEQYDAELLRLKDRHDNDFCVGPTAEEVITDIARREVRSYKQLPVNYYQIQTKFRDERRPRFGVMRAREFVMKDAYSFHANAESLSQTYDVMFDAYHRIFERFGLQFRAVAADSGNIGGSKSHEFHVLADSGEDGIAWSPDTGYAANVELAPTMEQPRGDASAELTEVPTPKKFSCEDVAEFLSIPLETTVKMLVFSNATEDGIVAISLRGDHEFNDIKAARVPNIHPDLLPATEQQLKDAFGAGPGSMGPVGFDGTVYADFAAAACSDFVCGANKEQHHLTGVNWGRDCAEPVAMDLRNVNAGDPTPDGKGKLEIVRGIEVGHVFELGTKYSDAMDANVQGEDGKSTPMFMGCYGLGVTRVIAAAIEQNFDDNGIIWPTAIAPFQVAIVPMNMGKSERVRETALKLHDDLQAMGIDVLLDDRDARPGVKFADIELIGIPHRIVVGDRGLDNGELEYRARSDSDNSMIALDGVLETIKAKLG